MTDHRALESAVRATLSGLAGARATGVTVREGGKVGFVIETEGSQPTQADEALRLAAEAAVRGVAGVTQVTAVLTAHAERAPPRPAAPAPSQPQRQAPPAAAPVARAVVAVASAKGGVGKSTIAVNLAIASARMGLKVGLMDADVFGPSLPTMLGLVGQKPHAGPDRRILPIEAYGVKTMSIGYLVDAAQAVVWRGPMVMSALLQMLNETDWGDLDILFIDTPPGTGDVQLTLAQRAGLTGAVVVSTPQEVALADVRRGLALFEKTAVPVLGVIENMSWLETSPGGPRLHIFGEGGARRLAEAEGLAFLGETPILTALREGGDAGAPAVASDPVVAEVFAAIAAQVADAAFAGGGRPFPAIIFE